MVNNNNTSLKEWVFGNQYWWYYSNFLTSQKRRILVVFFFLFANWKMKFPKFLFHNICNFHANKVMLQSISTWLLHCCALPVSDNEMMKIWVYFVAFKWKYWITSRATWIDFHFNWVSLQIWWRKMWCIRYWKYVCHFHHLWLQCW